MKMMIFSSATRGRRWWWILLATARGRRWRWRWILLTITRGRRWKWILSAVIRGRRGILSAATHGKDEDESSRLQHMEKMKINPSDCNTWRRWRWILSAATHGEGEDKDPFSCNTWEKMKMNIFSAATLARKGRARYFDFAPFVPFLFCCNCSWISFSIEITSSRWSIIFFFVRLNLK